MMTTTHPHITETVTAMVTYTCSAGDGEDDAASGDGDHGDEDDTCI